MPVGFHHHHGAEPKGSGNTSMANRYTNDGNPIGYGDTARPARAGATEAFPSRSSGVSTEQLQRFDVLLARPENKECFDCGAKQPRWASTNLGIFFCLRCAGIHRSMGTHISKVKSTNMDAWGESMIQVMEHIGNSRARLLYEYNMPANARVTSSTEVSVLERALRSKYDKKIYYHPRFEELYAQFMATPIEGVGSSAAGAQPPNSNSSGTSPSLPQTSGPPRRATHTQPAAKPPLDELWGAPVSSPTAEKESSANAAGSANNTNITVAELFSGSCPAGVGVGPRSNSAWGTSPNPHHHNHNRNNSSGRAGNDAVSPHPSPSSATNSDWFDSNFGGSNGNPHASGAPSPATPQSPLNVVASRNNTDDLFQGSGDTPLSGRNAGSKEEILSLFASAPVAGAGGQSGSSNGSPNGGHPMAWQPQTVKPYYSPEQ
ncbi:hypothetical protein ABB37_01624 [Leptomonas pyrrhocoris]|uniref:Arf-GAP domain-containing protein n=1 Tax=Leptomonas pyrrhocoris TaxID=157538 RepID=A0A0N0DZJ5_LEPPY|nr:hypothetical protein ABB37_01624 [Leptomonas pyrrhocoris]KPA85282.1 hypothetical protein ABB37_01624 [Leptomonas pyrrhocoris]|eukprot:XP_015663721.1 hypothetical protein ABB37_01624 [Leptomonas pyrrhocoris]